jgi:probable O-glycosylation ligase (exosortase A-associated)
MVLGPDGSFIEGNTEIALALTMVVPLLRWLQLNTENKWLRWGLIVSMLLCAVAIIGSYSRGGFLAITAMGAFLWLKSPKKLVSGVLIAVFAPAVLAFMPDKWWDKMSTIQTYDEDNSAMGRINAWYFARNLAWDRPFVGGGFEAFSPESFLIWAPNPTHFQDAHSIWFEILGEHGYVGLMLYMLLWLLSWRTATKIARAAKGRPELTWASTLARMIQVSFIGYWVGGSFLGLAYWDFPYLLMVILVLTQTVVKREVAASGEVMSAVSHGPAPHQQPRAIRPAASPHAAGRP